MSVIPVFKQEVKPHHMIHEDRATQKVLQLARSVARTSSTVLLTGESGVGKEVFARAIHEASPRSAHAFIAVNCAALPSSLLESELFGHEKGAFSGAVGRHVGHFERADKGTILLDEISEVSLETQAKLLRVLQERVMLRVGGREEIKLDLRVIATTNRNLRECVDRGDFRLDLFYRLNVFPIQIPALRERREDIPALVLYYLSHFAQRFDTTISGITAEAMERLTAHRFDGNVRELVNVVERSVILCADEKVVSEEHIVLDTATALPDVSRSPSSSFDRRPSSRHLAALSSRKIPDPMRTAKRWTGKAPSKSLPSPFSLAASRSQTCAARSSSARSSASMGTAHALPKRSA